MKKERIEVYDSRKHKGRTDRAALTEEQLTNARIVLPEPKERIAIRLDRDVLDWFRAQGPGYQTRINAVLRAYMRLGG